ncbi:conserved hypothetical protein [Coccidioides posadasii str. Silveira]|uniref:Uncharacterized protein n=1 Tax=Coccidioides posadasii (strain RMSCC 757 / Silveira) TaxID=443226 RepID=E9CRV4_COCPS|nr:conserved hypothetical protein [Coccidioides posadasii str. Silveira]
MWKNAGSDWRHTLRPCHAETRTVLERRASTAHGSRSQRAFPAAMTSSRRAGRGAGLRKLYRPEEQECWSFTARDSRTRTHVI